MSARQRGVRLLVTVSLVASGLVATSHAAVADPAPTVLSGWGDNAKGQLGDGTTTERDAPQAIALPGGVQAASVSAGSTHSLAIGSDGNLYAWGDNTDGELGDGSVGGARTTPEPITLASGVAPIDISAGDDYSLAVGSDGNVYAWGDNNQLGGAAQTPAPQKVSLPGGVAATAVAAGGTHSLALGADGEVYAWGSNQFGEVGDGSGSSTQLTPEKILMPSPDPVVSIAANTGVSFAINSAGTLYGWGLNNLAQLGDSTRNERTTPVPVALPAGVTAKSVSAGDDFGLAVAANGDLYAWGYNTVGQFGDGTVNDSYLTPTPERVGPVGGKPVSAIAAGDEFALAITTDGTLYGWGYDSSGQLGDGHPSTTPKPTPTPITLPGGATTIAAGNDFGFALTGAVTPAFTAATPPTSVVAGAALSYQFVATGAPQPTYALAAGSPPWLSIDASTGLLSGTVPPDASAFTFSVTAANSAGTSTAGPFAVTVAGSTVPVSGTVHYTDGSPAADTLVQVCQTAGGQCVSDSSNSSGGFSVAAVPGSTISVTAYPLPQSGALAVSIAPSEVPEDGLDDVTIVLQRPAATDDVTFPTGRVDNGGTPVFNWQTPATMTATGCPDGIGTATVVVRRGGIGPWLYEVYPLTEDPAGSGLYTGGLPAQYPDHGPGQLSVSVSCPTPPGDQFLEPDSGPAAGGTTVTVVGSGFTGATALMFGNTAASSFAVLSDTVLQATTPPGTGTVPVSVQETTGSARVGDYSYSAGTGAGSGSSSETAVGAVNRSATPPNSHAARHAASDLEPEDSPGDLASTLYQSFAPLISPFAPTLRAAVDTAIAAAHPDCSTEKAALVSLIIAALAPQIALAVSGILPTAEGLALGFGVETGLGEILIAVLTAVAVKEMVAQYVRANVQGAVDAAFGDCSPPLQPNVLIDPSGTVLDTHGNPVAGATATILRADASTGPFTPVDVTQPGIEPAINPETTGSDGSFHWDVRSGYYEVSATKSGCTDPGSGADDAVIGPYPVPPPQVGLTVTLGCPDEPPAPTPVVTALDTHTGPPGGGTQLMITGSGFAPSATVTFGAAAATELTYVGPEELLATSPAGHGTVHVSVTTPGGSSVPGDADTFDYGVAPAVTALSTSSGPYSGGTQVTVSGTGFTGATVVGFGGTPGTDLHVQSDTELTVTSPAQLPGPADLTVTTPLGTSAIAAADLFTFTPPAPTCSDARARTQLATPVILQLSCTGEDIVFDPPPVPSHGVLSGLDSATGTLTYTPDAGFAGLDTLTYTAHNAGGTSVPASITITVTSPSTTTLAASASETVAGAPVTFSATISPAPGSGTAAFSDDGTPIADCQNVAVSAAGTAQCTTYFANSGQHSVTATFGGNPAESASTSTAATETVTGSCRAGTIRSLLLDLGSSTCLGPDAVVTGSITLTTGANLYVHGAQIHSLNALRGGRLLVCTAHVAGPLLAALNKGPIRIGGPSAVSGCQGNTFTASVELTANLGPVSVIDNTIRGSLLIELNTAAVDVYGNTVTGHTLVQRPTNKTRAR